MAFSRRTAASRALAATCAKTGAPAPAVVTLMASKENPAEEAWIVSPSCDVQILKLLPNELYEDFPLLESAGAGIERIDSIPTKTRAINITGSALSLGADLSAAVDSMDTVRLSDSALDSIDNIVFPDSTSRIDLRGNKISSLKNAKLPAKLTNLALYDIQLTSIDFKFPTDLRSLYMNNNPIKKLERLRFPNSARVIDFTDCPITTIRGVKFSSSLKNLFFGPLQVEEFEVRETDFANFASIASTCLPTKQPKCSESTAQLSEFKSSKLCVISDDRFAAIYDIEANGGMNISSESGSGSAGSASTAGFTVPNLGSQAGSGGSSSESGERSPTIAANTTAPVLPPSKDTATKGSKSSSTTTIVAIAVTIGVLFVVFLALVGYRVQKRRQLKRPQREDEIGEAKFMSHSASGNELSKTKTDSEDRYLSNDVRTDNALIAFHLDEQQVELGPQIARGGYGVILRGTYRGRTVAIKQMLPGTSHDDAALASFMDEIRMGANLTHPKIVEFIGVMWTSRRDISAVIEYMALGDLRKLLDKQHTLSPESWSQPWTRNGLRCKTLIAQDIAEAVVYLHSFNQPIMHRDLKARNVLLDRHGNAKLSDFGISRELTLEETMTREVGTAAWIAPEVLRGERYDEKADIYSFGVLLVEMDTSRHPFAGDAGAARNNTQLAVLVSAGKLRPAASPQCPPVVQSLVDQCLQFDAQRRPTAMEVFYALRQADRAFQQSAFV